MRRPSFPLVAFLIAATVRLIPVLAAADLGIGLDDMFQYDMLARSIVGGNGFRWYQENDLGLLIYQMRQYGISYDHIVFPEDPRGILTSFRAPLYPLFLAIVYGIFGLGQRFLAARLVQAFLTATLAPLTYKLAGHLGADEPRARLAAFVPALWPMLVILPLGLVTENLFMPLLTAGLVALFLAIEQKRMRDLTLAGGLLGLAVLTRSVIIGFPFLAAGWLWWRRMRRQAVVLVAMTLALTIPWAVRNSLLHGRPTFVETSLGYNLYMGYHPEGDGSFQWGISLDLITILDDAERDQLGREMALQFIQEDPLRAVWLVVRKLGHLWGLEERAFAYFYSNNLLGQWPPWLVVAVLALMILPLVVVLPLSVLGLTFGKRTPAWWLCVILLVYYTIVHVLIMAEERFHLVLVPLLAALVARGLTLWPDVWGDLRSRKTLAWRLAALAGAVLLLMLLNWGLELAIRAEDLAKLASAGGNIARFSY